MSNDAKCPFCTEPFVGKRDSWPLEPSFLCPKCGESCYLLTTHERVVFHPTRFAVPTRVATLAETAAFVRGVSYVLGLGFHPDTPFRDYVSSLGGLAPYVRTFDAKTAELLTKLRASAFDIYGTTAVVWREMGLTDEHGDDSR